MQKEVKAPWDGVLVSSYTLYAMREVNYLTMHMFFLFFMWFSGCIGMFLF